MDFIALLYHLRDEIQRVNRGQMQSGAQPTRTPQEAVDKLAEAARAAMADPALRARLTSLGQQIPPVEQQNAAALAAHTKAEIDKWHPIIREAGIKAE